MLMGREISICMLGDHLGSLDIRAISWTINGQPDYLDTRLFTYALKYLGDCEFTAVNEDHILTPALRRSCEKMFRILDKVEVIRIDGRITMGGFHAFELSPDLDLRPDGELAAAFSEIGYSDLLQRLVRNALERHRRQPPVNDEDKVVSSVQSMRC